MSWVLAGVAAATSIDRNANAANHFTLICMSNPPVHHPKTQCLATLFLLLSGLFSEPRPRSKAPGKFGFEIAGSFHCLAAPFLFNGMYLCILARQCIRGPMLSLATDRQFNQLVPQTPKHFKIPFRFRAGPRREGTQCYRGFS